jgi:hypothetical protein
MTAPFGFSVGDFIRAIELIATAGKALKDSGGASDDYQSVIAELSSLRAIFEELISSISSPSSSRNSCNASIRKHTTLTLELLAKFLQDISKFNADFGPEGLKGFHHGSRKVQWASSYAEKVEKLRVAIGTQLQTLNLILVLELQWVSLVT